MARYTLCPFYKSNKRKTIACEDCFHRFDEEEDLQEHMNRYCDQDWQECSYAKDLMDAYELVEKGDENALEDYKRDAKDAELKSLSSKLGRAEKRIEARDQEIRDLRKKNRDLDQKCMEMEGLVRKVNARDEKMAEHLRETQKKLHDITEDLSEKIGKAMSLYKDRLCYMISEYAGGELPEEEVERWAEGKEFSIILETEDGNKIWKVYVKEDSKGDQEVQEQGELLDGKSDGQS